MSPILFAVSTCNRSFYAKNSINSLIKFSDLDRIKILILDNCTIEEGWLEYLNSVATSHNILIHREEKRRIGELYHSMNWAIQYCRKEKIKIVHWLQDDYQFTFQHKPQIDSIIELFNQHPFIIQVRTNLVFRGSKTPPPLLYGSFSSNTIHYAGGLRPADNGYTRVDVYDKTGLYPENSMIHYTNRKELIFGEKWFGQTALKHGYRQVTSLLPNICPLFDTCYIRGNQRLGTYLQPKNEFYIKPFTDQQIGLITQNNQMQNWSYIDEFAETDGWQATTQEKHNVEAKAVLLPKSAQID